VNEHRKLEPWRENRLQDPDKRISWRSVSGSHNAGTVRFEPLEADRTRVRLVMAYEPEGPVESLGDGLGLFERQVQRSVEQFKRFIEMRNAETGGWPDREWEGFGSEGLRHGDLTEGEDAPGACRKDRGAASPVINRRSWPARPQRSLRSCGETGGSLLPRQVLADGALGWTRDPQHRPESFEDVEHLLSACLYAWRQGATSRPAVRSCTGAQDPDRAPRPITRIEPHLLGAEVPREYAVVCMRNAGSDTKAIERSVRRAANPSSVYQLHKYGLVKENVYQLLCACSPESLPKGREIFSFAGSFIWHSG
jgi:hypothetical protein